MTADALGRVLQIRKTMEQPTRFQYSTEKFAEGSEGVGRYQEIDSNLARYSTSI